MTTVLEERLEKKSGADVRIEILERLSAIDQLIVQRISSGVSRHEYAEWQKIANAVHAAIRIVSIYPQ